ncbi:hypothetical protein [Endozoicomonas sp.]|uniref:hypothetical protein n=1 Tax=Endozoicomonas sp. TaxID=1892382 RepID=UPI00383BE98E
MKPIPWGPVRSLLTNFTFAEIKEITGYADLDISSLAHMEQKSGTGSASKSQLLTAIDKQISLLDHKRQARIATICCEEMLSKKPELTDRLDQIFSRIGWKYSGSTLLPIDVFDASELMDMPEKAHDDITKAAARLRDGDLSGSLSAACGALDSVTSSIYREFSLGNPNDDSFQTRITKSLNAIAAKDKLQTELESLSWEEPAYKPFLKNLEGSLNQAAYVMQKLRSDMGDVHGTKPVLNALAYDSIKWSLLLLRLLNTR